MPSQAYALLEASKKGDLTEMRKIIAEPKAESQKPDKSPTQPQPRGRRGRLLTSQSCPQELASLFNDPVAKEKLVTHNLVNEVTRSPCPEHHRDAFLSGLCC